MFCAVSLGLAAQSFTPTKRVMIEDHTIGGAWFGWWSPRGIVFLEQFMMETPATEYEVACIHGNNGADDYGNFDAMHLPEYSDPAASSDLMTGWPCFLADRKESSSYEAETTLPTKHEAISDDFGYANLTIEPIFDSNSRSLSVVTNVHFAVYASNFRLALVLTEDSVHQPGVDGYTQTNAYNFYNGDAPDVPMASSSVDFNAQGPVVPSDLMTFRHVARSIIPSYEGDPSSLPMDVWADGQYSFTFPTQIIPEDYDETKMRAIVLLINGSNGEVVNCLGADFNETETSNSYGCTDALACNYDPDAVDDDGTCDFTSCASCTDPSACNFNASASSDDGSCDYSCCPGPGCCGEGTTWDELSQTCVSEYSGNACDLVYDGNEDGIVGSGDLLGLLTEFGAECTPELSSSCGNPVSYQGYDYATVLIGEQCWFAENLRNQNYANGDNIASNLNQEEWADAGGYSAGWPDFIFPFGATSVFGEGSTSCLTDTLTGLSGQACNSTWSLNEYGRLYNFQAVTDSRGLCPAGWHVPMQEEWLIMIDFLGGAPVAGAKLKSSEGWDNNYNGNNESGFSALPGGFRSDTWSSGFLFAGWSGKWWTSSSDNPFQSVYSWSLRDIEEGASFGSSQIGDGLSVRCVQDAE